MFSFSCSILRVFVSDLSANLAAAPEDQNGRKSINISTVVFCAIGAHFSSGPLFDTSFCPGFGQGFGMFYWLLFFCAARSKNWSERLKK